MCRILFYFLSHSDISTVEALSKSGHQSNQSPIAHFIRFYQDKRHDPQHDSQWKLNKIVLINSYCSMSVDHFFDWLRIQLDGALEVERFDRPGVQTFDFSLTYHTMLDVIDQIDLQYAPTLVQRLFLLNPEFSVASAVGLLLGKTIREARLFQYRAEKDPRIEELEIPFEVSASMTSSRASFGSDGVQEVPTEMEDMVHSSALMKRVLERVERVAQFHVPVLIMGESGTGKTKLAQMIHKQFFKDKNRPFVVVNCGAIPKNLLESELFGSSKGAFTGALYDRKGLLREAHGGSLFLDEIAELSLDAQSKLLRVLDTQRVRSVGDSKEYQVEFRLICATHQNLRRLVSDGLFREDLFYRLAVATVTIPPLRERLDDLRPLVGCLLRRVSRRLKQPLTLRLHRDTWSLLRHHAWYGNVRELENVLTQAILWRSHPDSLYADDVKEFLPEQELKTVQTAPKDCLLDDSIRDWNLPKAMDEIRHRYIIRALQESAGNRRQAARLLGLNHVTLLNWIKRLEL